MSHERFTLPPRSSDAILGLVSQANHSSPYEALSTAERIELPSATLASATLVQQLWDEIAESPDEIELTAAQCAELDRRLEDYRRDPDPGVSWASLRASLRSST